MWIKAGNDANLPTLCKDKDDNIIDNLASANEIICQIKTTKDADPTIEKKMTDTQILVDNPLTGYLKIIIDAVDTADLNGTFQIAVEIQWTGNTQEINLEDINGKAFETIQITKHTIK